MSKRNSLITIIASSTIIIAVIVFSIYNKVTRKQEADSEETDILSIFAIETPIVETETGGTETPASDEELDPEYPEQGFVPRIRMHNMDNLEVLLSMSGHEHLIEDLQGYLDDQDMKVVKKLYVIEDSETFLGGVTYFDLRMDTEAGILKISYVEKEDKFYFDLER